MTAATSHQFVRDPQPIDADLLTEAACPECFEPLRRCRCPDELPPYRGAFDTEGRY